MPMASKSRTITDTEWLHNSHAGELLVSEFMEPHGLDANTLARALAIPSARLQKMIDGDEPVDADLDLRLARYFRMSEGFFMGLQADYELLEAKRAKGDELERIVPRAA